MRLHPFSEVVTEVGRLIDDGVTIYQQFNCVVCGIKQTMAEPNKLYTQGVCEECGATTNIQEDGCNYAAVFGRAQPRQFHCKCGQAFRTQRELTVHIGLLNPHWPRSSPSDEHGVRL